VVDAHPGADDGRVQRRLHARRPIPVDDFAAFFLAGYLLWQFFQNSCQGAIHSIVGNGDLVKKVYFPREVLPLSHVLAQLIHLLLALLVISPYLIVTAGGGCSSTCRRPCSPSRC
jgi:ABC-type polysaccharide/polyol phosphate export permease